MTDPQLQHLLKETLPPPPLGDDASLEELLDAQQSDPAYGQGMLARARRPEKKSSHYLALAAAACIAVVPVAMFFLNDRTGTNKTAQATPPTNGSLVQITPDFPEPAFFGTPLDIKLPNLEPAQSPRLTFTAPEGVHLISQNAKVTSSEPQPLLGELQMVTDGQKIGDDTHFVELPPGHQWIQIDLGTKHQLFAITLWHYHKKMRAYRDVVIQASPDPSFSSGTSILYNNDHDNSLGLGTGKDPAYIETNHGRIIDVDGITARYIRLHSNGNTTDELNHYTEVEVYGQ